MKYVFALTLVIGSTAALAQNSTTNCSPDYRGGMVCNSTTTPAYQPPAPVNPWAYQAPQPTQPYQPPTPQYQPPAPQQHCRTTYQRLFDGRVVANTTCY
jgi:hypothetical protein